MAWGFERSIIGTCVIVVVGACDLNVMDRHGQVCGSGIGWRKNYSGDMHCVWIGAFFR